MIDDPVNFDRGVGEALFEVRKCFQAAAAIQVAQRILLDQPQRDPAFVLNQIKQEAQRFTGMSKFCTVMASLINDLSQWMVPGRIEYVVACILTEIGPLGPKEKLEDGTPAPA